MYSLYPKQDLDVWNLYYEMRSKQWNESKLTAELDKDKSQFNALSDKETILLKKVMAFFAVADSIINKNISDNLEDLFPEPAFQICLHYQMFIEDIHQITYNEFINSYISDSNERFALFKSIESDSSIIKKAKWMTKSISGELKKSKIVLRAALMEGVFFTGAFAIVFWFRERGLLQGFSKANEYIFEDELDHVKSAILMYKRCKRLSEESVFKIAKDAFELEYEFYSFFEGLPGMTKTQLMNYIKYRVDEVVSMLGYNRIYNISNPLKFAEKQEVGIRSSSFFTSVGTDYIEKEYEDGDLELSFSDEE